MPTSYTVADDRAGRPLPTPVTTEPHGPDFDEQAARFLTLLDETAERWTFQTFDDNKTRKDPTLALVLHGTLEEHWQTLCDLSSRGAGVFITVNETNGRGCKTADMIRVRAVFQECDRPGTPEPPLQPHIVVESSPGKYHRYWLVDGGHRFDLFEQVMARLVADFGSDPNAKDRARVLRLPGFPHPKDPVHAWRVRVIHESGEQPYSWEQITAAIPPLERPKKASKTPAGTVLDDPAKVRSALAVLDPDMEYSNWLQVGMALHHATAGGAEGLAIWDEWSARGTSYRPGETQYKWSSFRGNGQPVTLASVFKRAAGSGWRWQDVPRGNGHDTEPPDRERPPLEAYQDETEPRQGAGDHWPRLEPDDKPPHITTDQANGYRIASQVGSDLLYVIRIGWHAWTGTHWRLGEEFAYRKAQRLSRLILAESATTAQQAANTEDSEKRLKLMALAEALTGWAAKSESRDRVHSAMALAKPMLAVEHSELDRNHWLLNCTNGTLDLRTGKLRPHRRDDFITRCIPVAYDSEATCPTWLAFLDRIFASTAEVIHFARKAAGYSLTGNTSEQCVFFLWGVGQNGKSTFLKTIQALMGAYAQQAAPDLLVVSKYEQHSTQIAELRGARLVASIETGDGRRLNEPLIKQMSGEDRMKGRFMRQDNIEFDPSHKVFLATNHKPVIRGTDYAIWRRIRLIPFTVTIPPEARNPKLAEKLKAELPGILAWVVQGCLEWQREGLEPPKEVIEATDQYRTDSDVLKVFFEDHCVIEKNASVPKGALYEAYKEWCDRSGERSETQRRFSERMQERGFREYKTTGGLRTWRGIGLIGSSGTSGASGANLHMSATCDFSQGTLIQNCATNATYATNAPPADNSEV